MNLRLTNPALGEWTTGDNKDKVPSYLTFSGQDWNGSLVELVFWDRLNTVTGSMARMESRGFNHNYVVVPVPDEKTGAALVNTGVQFFVLYAITVPTLMVPMLMFKAGLVQEALPGQNRQTWVLDENSEITYYQLPLFAMANEDPTLWTLDSMAGQSSGLFSFIARDNQGNDVLFSDPQHLLADWMHKRLNIEGHIFLSQTGIKSKAPVDKLFEEKKHSLFEFHRSRFGPWVLNVSFMAIPATKVGDQYHFNITAISK